MSLFTPSNPIVGSLLGDRDTGVAETGNYFTALTPTPGTGIIGHAAPTTFDQTKAYFLLYNPGPLNVYPLYMRLHTTVVSAGDTTGPIFWTQVIDAGNRFSSGGTNLTPNSVNLASGPKSLSVITVGAVVCSANSGTSRTIGHNTFHPGTIDVLHDQYDFLWGAPQAVSFNLLPTTTASHLAAVFAPVVIQPNSSFLIHQWAAGQSTGPTLEIEFGFIEK